MSDIAISFENISKQYRLGTISTGTISHDFNRWWHKVRGKEDPYLKIGEVNDRSAKATGEYVWALRGISFDVRQGEVLGIIGKNGAGKSTLLKILSRVTSPTIGSIKARGRIASLLEVGTGFHPEMTGRENIFMNGAIMGMTKREIKSKLDEIVDFAGIEKYVDTPVKRYSSGMTVRLGFAIAAHLEPEILVVDEVLAVGDAEFQKKAIGKMQDVSRGEGRTVLFVSHNMASMQSLCQTGILLKNGLIEQAGLIDDVVSYYLLSNRVADISNKYICMKKKEKPYFKNILIKQGDNDTGIYDIDKPIVFEMEYDDNNVDNLTITVLIENEKGIVAYHSTDEFVRPGYRFDKNFRSCIVQPYGLAKGKYSCTFAIAVRNIEIYEKLENQIAFEVRFTGQTAELNSENSWKAVTGPGLLDWR